MEVVLREKPIGVPSELLSWINSIKTKVGLRILENLNADTSSMDRYIECAEVKELPGTFICCSFYQQDINDALTRAGLFMGAGKGTKVGTLTEQKDFSLINYKKLVAGHNLPGQIVIDFFESAKNSKNMEQKFNLAEESFYRNFLQSERIQKIESAFYVIGFAIQSMKDQSSVVSHEVFHAHYFLNAKYRDAVNQFWRQVVSQKDRDLIKEEIGRAYNVEAEDLVIDEFQAYVVQNRAEADRMKAFVPKYREPLLSALSNAGLKLVLV